MKHDCCASDHAGHDHAGHDHAGHDHASMMSGPQAAADFLHRFFYVTLFLLPLVLLTPTAKNLLSIPSLAGEQYLQFGLATIIFLFSLVFFQHAGHEIKAKKYGMMTLVSIAVLAGYAFSAVATFVPALDTQFYVEISTLIWVLLFGHYLEAKSSTAAGDALAEVSKLLPSAAQRVVGNKTEAVAVETLKVEDIVQVRAGEKVPADGVIVKGEGSFNEAHISGESKAITKSIGMAVVAGAILDDGSVRVKLTQVGDNSTIGQIKKLVAAAQQTKPAAQRLADVWAGRLTYTAVVVALLAVIVWSLVLGEPLVFSLTLAITVLVIACPHALGMAIPTVTTISTRLAVKNGLFIKDLTSLEKAVAVDHVLFDKTGTLTTGIFSVHRVVPFGKNTVEAVLKQAAAVESHSSHVLGKGIVQYVTEQKISWPAATGIAMTAGQGISGKVKGELVAVGGPVYMKTRRLWSKELDAQEQQLTQSGETVIYVAVDKIVVGALVLADAVKPEAKRAVAGLRALGITVAMLTGDNQAVAAAVAKQLGIDHFRAGVQPKDKYALITELQQKGATVLMVGDGVNDAPALKQANVGLAVGSGTDVAVEAGDVVLTESNPLSVVRFITLSRRAVRKMKQNLWWALGYNIIAIPAAAGVLIPWGIQLRPELGAIVMSLSTVIVVANSLTLLAHKELVE